MKVPTSYRGWHIAAAVGTATLAGLLFYFRPALGKDTITLIGSIGSFITLYGTLLAIIELKRAKSAVEESTSAAKRVFSGMTKIIDAERITECRSAIKTAVTCIENDTAIPQAIIIEILESYERVFHAELDDEKSIHRENKAHILTYRYIKKSTRSTKYNSESIGNAPSGEDLPYEKTRAALLSITTQFSSRQSKQMTFSEITE
ncbi:hypothetical protein G3O00_03070 [Burkholderia sp. Ac-20384]|uniref:hypothetical protein n=1 Tax=Burkholderia sp. Ac-20384 TaxID=2703902 RepID=UPI00197E3EDF|nr:hypothetical protein [Burkholderia sp. Ac-20384]MBN3822599.1 hypothetical protein [Burkholderia sp. Ac-20384]